MSTSTLLKEAIETVKAGQRKYACELFLELVTREPTNEMAWIWLSGLLEEPEDRLKALENSLLLSSGGPDKENRLKSISAMGANETETKFRAAIKAIDERDRKKGLLLLNQVIAENQEHEQAWMALSQLTRDEDERINALKNVVNINPNNFKAQNELTKLQHDLYQKYLERGHSYQKHGEFKRAIDAYKLAEKYASSGVFRSAVQQRIALIQQKSVPIRTTNPTFTMTRLAVGPPILYLLLILIQSGLNPLQIPPLFCVGGIVVTLGSFLASASTYAPNHPIWGSKGLTHSIQRLWKLIGVLLILLPFVIWLVGAIQRLNLAHLIGEFSNFL